MNEKSSKAVHGSVHRLNICLRIGTTPYFSSDWCNTLHFQVLYYSQKKLKLKAQTLRTTLLRYIPVEANILTPLSDQCIYTVFATTHLTLRKILTIHPGSTYHSKGIDSSAVISIHTKVQNKLTQILNAESTRTSTWTSVQV